MKKFKFNLQKLLDYKSMLLDESKNNLANLQHQLDSIKKYITNLELQIHNIHCKLTSKTSQGTTIDQIKGYNFQQENAIVQIKALNLEVNRFEEAIEKQIEVVVELSKEVAELEKVQEKQLIEYNLQLSKAEELVIAEYISSRIAIKQAQ